MNFTAAVLFFLSSAIGMSAGYRHMNSRQPSDVVQVRHSDIESKSSTSVYVYIWAFAIPVSHWSFSCDCRCVRYMLAFICGAPAEYCGLHVFTEFRKVVSSDLASKADELIDMIVADVERMISEHEDLHPSFIQNNFKENAKKLIKNAVITIAKHMLPLFEKWIAESVKPPVTTSMVYSALVRPIGESVFHQIYVKLNLPATDVWKTDDKEEFDAGLVDGEEAAELEA